MDVGSVCDSTIRASEGRSPQARTHVCSLTRDAQHADAAGPLAPDRRHQCHGCPGLPVALASAPEHEHARAGLVVVPDWGDGGVYGWEDMGTSVGVVPTRPIQHHASTDRPCNDWSSAAAPKSPKLACTDSCLFCGVGGGGGRLVRRGRPRILPCACVPAVGYAWATTHPPTHAHTHIPIPIVPASMSVRVCINHFTRAHYAPGWP